MTKANIYGTEYKFCFSVGASREVAKLCTNGNLSNLYDDINNMSEIELIDFICQLAVIMNKAAIMREHFERGLPMKDWEHIEPLTVEVLQSLDQDEFITKIRDNIFGAMSGDSETTIEVEEYNESKNAESRA